LGRRIFIRPRFFDAVEAHYDQALRRISIQLGKFASADDVAALIDLAADWALVRQTGDRPFLAPFRTALKLNR
jgi:hypothetical protein